MRVMDLELRPSSSFTLDELARIFTAAYEGYFVPFEIDEGAMRFMVDAFSFALAASRVALVDGEPVGLANLGVRGDRCWVGGVGVVPDRRRTGIGRALMNGLIEEARALGLSRMILEVMEQNEGAYRLYDELGFETMRWVGIWSLPGADAADSGAPDADFALAHARVRAARRTPEPWQRADETLAYYATLDPPPRGLEFDDGAAVFRPAGGTIQLVQIAGDVAACRAMLEAVSRRGPVSVLNLPIDDPASEALVSLGAECRLRQREMVLAL
jgi:ribosomal protein S18 acetylase RimI-like enzyme